ncbi:hypothetical protein [Flavobacterium sp.]|uniref:hypothetical protein n=1 Tax=Flavobacterium sp. TaxID=239 RepID=UPI00286DEC01|nr:hypothetical protein [Flavobacterium sp.]
MNKPKTKKYNIYKIKSGDTLLTIAEALGKESSEVIRFHNVFAKQEELISYEFPAGLDFLYITPLISEKHIDNVPKVNFLYDKKLAIKPFKTVLMYDVALAIHKGNRILNIDCKMTVAYLQKVGDYTVFKIDRIPDPEQEWSSVMHEFLEEVTKSIYPLELIVNDDGNWIGIQNFESIAKRWKSIKLDLLDYYEGYEIVKRLLYYDTLFKDENRLTDLLQKDVFLKTYFNGLYANHTQMGYFEPEMDFPILPDIKNVSYKVVQKIEEYVTDDTKIALEKKGAVNDARSLLDYDYNLDEASLVSEIPAGSYVAIYVLNSKNNTIENVNMQCAIELNETKEIKITIAVVE